MTLGHDVLLLAALTTAAGVAMIRLGLRVKLLERPFRRYSCPACRRHLVDGRCPHCDA